MKSNKLRYYPPFGSSIPELQYAYSDGADTSKYRFGFNGKEIENESFEGCISFEARIFDSRLARFYSTDPREIEYSWQTPYSYFKNSPVSILDINGEGGPFDAEAEGVGGDLNYSNSSGAGGSTSFSPSSFLIKGTDNVIIMIKDDMNPMEVLNNSNIENQDEWDYVYASNIEGASEILRKSDAYGGKNGIKINKLIIQSHGSPGNGPKIATNGDNKPSHTFLDLPESSKGLKYIRSILTNSATIVLTACSIISGYGSADAEKNSKAKSISETYARFFLYGTKRELFLNMTQTKGTRYYTGSPNSIWFNFDKELVNKDEKNGYWAGFYRFYYNDALLLNHDNYHYKMIVDSVNGLILPVKFKLIK